MFNLRTKRLEYVIYGCLIVIAFGAFMFIRDFSIQAQVPDAPAVATMKAAGLGDVIAYEALTVSFTPKAFTAATMTTDVKKAFCTLETNSIYFTMDNAVTTPTSAGVGHKLDIGQTLTLNGYSQIAGFRAVRSSSTSATLKCTYLK